MARANFYTGKKYLAFEGAFWVSTQKVSRAGAFVPGVTNSGFCFLEKLTDAPESFMIWEGTERWAQRQEQSDRAMSYIRDQFQVAKFNESND